MIKYLFQLFIGCTIILSTSSGRGLHPIRITGNLQFLEDGDSVQLIVYEYGQFYSNLDLQKIYISRVVNHRFRFEVPARDHPRYINLGFPQKVASQNLYGYLIESGDNISIIEKEDAVLFSGKGHEKWDIQSHLRNMQTSHSKILPDNDAAHIKQRFELTDSLIAMQIGYLNLKRSELSKNSFILLGVDAMAKSLTKMMSIRSLPDSELRPIIQALSGYKNNLFPDFLTAILCGEILEHINDDLGLGFVEKYRFDSCLLMNRKFVVRNCYDYLKKTFSGFLRERIITAFLFNYRNKSADISWCISDALITVTNKDFRGVLQKLKLWDVVGANAFNFSLPDINGKIKTLSDFKGKVVLIDFWFTGCPACAAIQPKLTEIEHKFLNENFVLISISIDKNRDEWIKSVRSSRYTSFKAINLFTEGKGKFHPIVKLYNIISFPTLILVDKQGKICQSPIDPRIDDGKNLSSLITNACKGKDLPY
jgi:thiol-disulfide isomerase/thioredoxin